MTEDKDPSEACRASSTSKDSPAQRKDLPADSPVSVVSQAAINGRVIRRVVEAGCLVFVLWLALNPLLLRKAPGPEKAIVFPDLYEASLSDLQDGLQRGYYTSSDLVKAYFARIEEVNLQGPSLRAVTEFNPSALAVAAQLDQERIEGLFRGQLHGIPILLKDNIATISEEGMNTTAGSWALYKSIVPGDAGVVKRLRKAGAIILGKATMSEWAHFRGNQTSGWSGRGGQCTNPFYPLADPCGSSSGSGVATAIGLAAVSLGTETDGSITCPSAYNNLVGIKPTVGLTSRAGVIPISEHQDTVGPMARSVRDAAMVLNAIAGPDPSDNYTTIQPSPVPNYLDALKKDALKGKRIGVPRQVHLNSSITAIHPSIKQAFEDALKIIEGLGATIVDPANIPSAAEIFKEESERFVTAVDFKIQLNAWFDSLLSQPSNVTSLSDLIIFNNANPDLELPPGYEDQSILFDSNYTSGDRNATFWSALAKSYELGRTKGIDAALSEHSLDALVLPAEAGTSPSAIAGYPIVTVPLGFLPEDTEPKPRQPGIELYYPAPNVPFGLCFFGTQWSEFDLIGFAYAYEQATLTKLKKRAYEAAIPKTQLRDIVG